MIVAAFNRTCSLLADLVLAPWRFESPWPGLTAASFVAAAVLIPVFAWFSNPRTLRRSRGRLLARTLEPLLFQHDLRISVSALGRILAANARYLSTLLLPLLAAIVPMLAVFVQMACYFEQRPFREGETGAVIVQLDEGASVMNVPVSVASLQPQAMYPSVRIPSRNEVAFRVSASQAGEHLLQVHAGDSVEEMAFVVDHRLRRLSPRRVRDGIWNPLMSPGQPPLPSAGQIVRIEVQYPPRELLVGESSVPWWLASIVLMMVFGLVLGRVFGVPIA